MPSNHSLAAIRRLSDMASLGFKGSSMIMRSAPRPVSTPPTEVAKRNPPCVVTSSCSGDRAEDRRVGNRARYHDAIMMARQSRANLSESSWP